MLALSLNQLADIARGLPARLARAEDQLGRILSIATDARSLIHHLALPPVEATFVYLLPPTGPLFAQRAFVKKGAPQQLRFETVEPIEPGVWIVVAGPSIVRTVRIGNTFQSAQVRDSAGQIGKTVEVWTPGTYLTVELEA